MDVLHCGSLVPALAATAGLNSTDIQRDEGRGMETIVVKGALVFLDVQETQARPARGNVENTAKKSGSDPPESQHTQFHVSAGFSEARARWDSTG